jgi:hypothetical protein
MSHAFIRLSGRVGDQFPDLEPPNTRQELVRLSHVTRPCVLDKRLGFSDGYPSSCSSSAASSVHISGIL